MKESQKAAIEEAAEKYATERSGRGYWHHKAGQKEVIEHPERHSLYTKEQYEQALKDGYNQGLSDGARQTVDYVNKNILK